MITPLKIIQLKECASTNDELAMHLANGAQEGTIILAEKQTSGRGRLGRSWDSPAGNLYASLLLFEDRTDFFQLTYVLSIALYETLKHFLPYGISENMSVLSLKWPNDVLLNGKKISGMLLESRPTYHLNETAIIIGLGVNLTSSPSNTHWPASNLLAEWGAAPSAGALIETLWPKLQKWRQIWHKDGFSPIKSEWMRYAPSVGSVVHVRQGENTISGRFLGLDADGGLELALADQQLLKLHAGDMMPEPQGMNER